MGVYHVVQHLTLPYFGMSTGLRNSTSVVMEKTGNYCITFIAGIGVLLFTVYNFYKVFDTSLNLQDTPGLIGSLVGNIVSGKQHGIIKTSSNFDSIETTIMLASGKLATRSSFYSKTGTVNRYQPSGAYAPPFFHKVPYCACTYT